MALKKLPTPRILSPKLVDIGLLKPHPRNYRKHGSDQIAELTASVDEHGCYRNIVTAADYTILAGHGVWETLKSRGFKQVPAVVLPYGPKDPRALKVLAGDNETARAADVDDRGLTDILRDIHKSPSGLAGTGFNPMQLANLVYVTRPASEIADFNAAAHWVGLPEYHEEDKARRDEITLTITFKTKSDREKFVAEKKLKVRDKRTETKWSTMWPFTERHDVKSLKFEGK